MKNALSYLALASGLMTFTIAANATVPVASVPEPSSLGLLGLALVIAGLVSRKK